MRTIGAFPLFLALAACGSERDEASAADNAALFSEAGQVPECASLGSAAQGFDQAMGSYIASATFTANEDCMSEWDDRLFEAGFGVRPPNGEFLSRERPDVMVVPHAADTRFVMILSTDPVDGVEMRD